MKYIDINRKFTAAVSSYMMQGYTLNSSTMGGSQGEVAHIDLTLAPRSSGCCSKVSAITRRWSPMAELS